MIRGAVYRTDLGRHRGHEQGGKRLGLVVSPSTHHSRSWRSSPVDQVRSIDVRHVVGDPVGYLMRDQLMGVELALAHYLGVHDATPPRLSWSPRSPSPTGRAVSEDGAVVNERPTLFLAVGLPAAGKTSTSRRLEVEHGALRLTKDEWMKALYGDQNPSSASDVIEGRLIEIGLRALELGVHVVIDFGLWSRDERSALRQAAADRGANVEMLYLEVSPIEQRRRLDRRQTDEPHTTWPISDTELAGWAEVMEAPTSGEVDGSEPIDDPPPGFGSWDEWRAARWPATNL